jgi:hypothetical protein
MNDAQALLSDLHEQGFRLTPDGRGGIRVKPASRLSPEVAETIRANVPALLVELRGQACSLVDDTERQVAALQRNPAWRKGWQTRIDQQRGKSTIQNVINTVNACLAVARGHCEAGDLEATRSACTFVLDCANGKVWERNNEQSGGRETRQP